MNAGLILGFLGVYVVGISIGKALERRHGVLLAAGIYVAFVALVALCTGHYPSGPLVNR